MERRALGGQGLEVSAVGLGCMWMSDSYGKADEPESLAVIDRALELGVTFFDTANVYGVGHNEQLVGKALAGRRDRFELATKFGIGGFKDGKMFVNGQPDYVRQCCDESLARLGVDTIDLYYLHRVDKSVPIEDTVGAMAGLVEAGKVPISPVRGVGGDDPAAHATHPITALQSEWSLFHRDPEDEVLPTLRELGIAFVPFSPLGRASSAARSNRPTTSPRATCAATTRGCRARTSCATSSWSTG